MEGVLSEAGPESLTLFKEKKIFAAQISMRAVKAKYNVDHIRGAICGIRGRGGSDLILTKLCYSFN